jgi:O-antigen/teichoic acid export membrane protein
MFFISREYRIRFRFSAWGSLRSYCTPILIFNLLTWVIAYINTYIIKYFNSTADVGIYAFAVQCTLIIEYVQTGLVSTTNPQVYQLWKKQVQPSSSAAENRFHHVFSLLSVMVIALNILLLPFLIHVFVNNQQFYDSIHLLPILCVSFVFRGLYNLYILPIYYFKQTKVLPRVLFIASCMQIIGGIWLTKTFGISGAVWSYLLIKPVQVLLLWLQSRRLFNFQFNSMKMVVIPVLYAAAVILIWQYGHLSEWQFGAAQALIALVLAGGIYWRELAGLPTYWKGLRSK